MSATATVTHEKPGLPPDTTFEGIFELVYKKGNVLSRINFKAKDKDTAIEKGHKYCEKKQLRFIHVNTWLFDLDEMTEHSDEAR